MKYDNDFNPFESWFNEASRTYGNASFRCNNRISEPFGELNRNFRLIAFVTSPRYRKLIRSGTLGKFLSAR